jgi:hypothetical protein
MLLKPKEAQTMKGILLFTIMSMLVFSSSTFIHAETKDHPVIKPIPGSTLDSDDSEFSSYVAYTFKYKQDGKTVEKKIKGKYWRLEYQFLKDDGKRDESVSELEIIENYKQASLEKNGEVLGEDSRNLLFTLNSEGKKYWVHLEAGSWKGWYCLNIIEQKDFKNKLSMASEIEEKRMKHRDEKPAGGNRASDLAGGDFATLVDAAVRYHGQGKNIETVETLRKAILSIWDDVPLTVRNIKLISEPDNYALKKNNIYQKGEPIYITSQIYGHKMKIVGDSYHINITTDFLLLDKNGKVLAGQEGAYTFDHISPIPKFDFSLDLTYTFSGLTPGTYKIQTTVNDNNSANSKKFENIIEIQ